MWTKPEGIEVGDSFTQEEIEDAYNTGFGYRISGINPRRDRQDRRYILLFANEDGPYNDSVTKSRFEYIGEGLDGDQNKNSPGNSALIDAQTSDIPIHFFYKRVEEADWEYQGRVDVVDYEFQEQDGRKMLVFVLEHCHQLENQQNSEQQNSTNKKKDENTVTVHRISNSGNAIYEKGDSTYNLGPLSSESVGEDITVKYSSGTYLFCDPKECKYADAAYGFYIARQMGKSFVPNEITVDVKRMAEVGAPSQTVVIGEIGKHRPVQVVLDEGKEGDVVRAEVSSVKSFLEVGGPVEAEVIEYLDSKNTSKEQKDTPPELPDSANQTPEIEIKKDQTELQQAAESEPQLTDNDEQYTETRRRARDTAFTQLVRDAYDEQCAICGSARESPDGNPEVEAAHIYPKRKGGSDDVRNGIALCKLHHWAFDSGWLSLTDYHMVLVRDTPDRNGYHEFKKLEGSQIRLPNREEFHPHPMFLREHRRLHQFNSDK